MFLFPTVRNEVAPDEQVQRMLFLHNVNFVISFAQFAHVSPLFNHTPSIKGASSIEVGEKPQEWQLGITLYRTRNRAVQTRRIFICAVLIAGDTLNQKGWTIHRPAF